MFRSLGEFVDALEREGALHRVRARVSPLLEIAEVADRVSKGPAPREPSDAARRNDPRHFDRGGPALLFEDVEGSEIPLLINAYGSYHRMELALGCAHEHETRVLQHAPGGFDAIAGIIAELVKPEPPRGLRDAIAKARQFAPLLRVGPRRLRRPGMCQELVFRGDSVDLTTLPIPRCWPHDGDPAAVGYPAGVNAGIEGVEADREDLRGRYITLAGVHTIHADDADASRPSSHNIGMYRMQLLGPRRLAMHWHVHHDGASHWRSWKRLGKRMPVAIALGGETVLPYAATCPLPPGISELLMAGFLNRGGIELCRARTVPLWVPANAEIVIEGWVSHEAGPIGWDPRDPDAGELGPGAVFEGPFGDHTGFYSLPDRYPIVEVTAITRRRGAVFPATIVGLPPQEDYYLGKATERIMLPLLRTIIHDIEDYDLPMFGAFHNCAFLRIDKAYPLHARRVMHAVWGAGQMSWTKLIAVVDEGVDVHDAHAVMRAIAERCRPDRDVERVRGPLDILDHAAPHLGAGTKLGFDATRRLPDESGGGVRGDAPTRGPLHPEEGEWLVGLASSLEGVVEARLPESLGRGWLLVRVEKPGPGAGWAALEALKAADVAVAPYVIVVSDVGLGDVDRVLFHWCAHADPGRDAMIVGEDEATGGRPWMGFDATPKVPGDERWGEPVRTWPPIIEMDAGTRALVERRSADYGLRLG
jgi:4-hydroxy-3-polyprenylbenzoate decarboxylase